MKWSFEVDFFRTVELFLNDEIRDYSTINVVYRIKKVFDTSYVDLYRQIYKCRVIMVRPRHVVAKSHVNVVHCYFDHSGSTFTAAQIYVRYTTYFG